MIEVRVGEPYGAKTHTTLLDRGDQLLTVIPGVNDDRIASFAIDKEIGVLLEWPRFEGDDIEGHFLPVHAVAMASRRAVRNFSAAIAAVVASPTAVVT